MKQINGKIQELWKQRINIIIESHRQKNRNVKIILEKDLENLGINKIFINKFLIMLWSNPKLIVNIIDKVDVKELKENLAPFIVDNFFNNYLSGSYVENNLLYIFALMIKNEVDKLTSIDQVSSFLDNTKCGILLEQLIKKTDVQNYFKKMIFETISKIENCSSRKINFNVNEINKKISWLKSEKDKDNYKNNLLASVKNSYKHNPNQGDTKGGDKNFSNNFLTDITTHYLEKLTKDDTQKENKDLKDYLGKLIEDIKTSKNPDLYSNSTLIQNLLNSNSPSDILAIYKEQITEIISFINKLIEDLTENTFLIPYSIKCICKIIFILLKNKFKNIRTHEINSFISKFFLGRLLIPILTSPSHNAYITDFVISENTLKNIKTTNIILLKLFSGTLFTNNNKDGNYTSFNKFFLEKMPQILSFFNETREVKLPIFIELLAENQLPDNFEYDYFEQNKESIYSKVAIAFKRSNLEILIKGIKNSKDFFENKNNKSKEANDKIEKFKLIYNKLVSGETMQNIKNIETKMINNYSNKLQAEYEMEQKKKEKNKKEKQNPNPVNEIECIFLFMDELYEKKYEYIFKLQNSSSNYYIDLKSMKKNNLTQNERVLINIKNYLFSTLGNYRTLDISDFKQETIKNTLDIFKELKNHITLPDFVLNTNTVPSEWYINSLLDNLPLLEESYKENDFLKLYKEVYQNLNQSIEELSFNYLIMFKNRIKFIEKAQFYYESLENSTKEIIINEKIKSMVENIFLPIDVQFKYDDDEDNDIFRIKYSNLKEKNFENKSFIQDNKKDIYIFKTIEAFASNFPDLVEYQIFQDENPIEIMTKLKMSNVLKEYFLLIREKIIKKNLLPENEFDFLYQNKIIDYFMNKIYDKIYPIEPETQDSEIYRKATMLSWVEPNLLINKDYIYETSLPDIIHQFQNVTSARTPQKKFNYIRNILELVNNLIIFNEGDKKDISLDDATPVLFYIFIKAHPFKIYTDLEFIKLFLDTKAGVIAFNIKQMESAIDMLMSFSEKNFGLSKEEYRKKCNSILLEKAK